MSIEHALEEMKATIISLKKAPVLFVGSGLSARYYETPGWDGLLEMVAEKVGVNKEILKTWGDNENKATELEYHAFCRQKPDYGNNEDRRTPLRNVIKEIVESKNEIVVEKHKETEEMSRIHPEAIITTNYDKLLENIFEGRYHVLVGQDIIWNGEGSPSNTIYKIHGCVGKPSSIVITREDYERFMNRDKYLYAKLMTMFWENPIVFIGYGIKDRNVMNILDAMLEVMDEDQREEFKQRVWIVSYSKDKNNKKAEEDQDIKENQDTKENQAVKECFEETKIEIGRNSIHIKTFYLDESYGKFYGTLREATEEIRNRDFRFTISDNAIDLLIKPLYQNQDRLKVLVRELLQNAQDACKMANKEIRVEIELLDGEKEWSLRVTDYGVGMDAKDMADYLLTVGKSGKEQRNYGLTGQFGIGILSVFLVGREAKIYSVKDNGQPVGICIYEEENNKKKVKQIPVDISLFEEKDRPSTIMEVKLTDIGIRERIEKTVEGAHPRMYSIKSLLGLENYYAWEGTSIQLRFCEEREEIRALCTEGMEKISDSFYIAKTYRDNSRIRYERGKALVNDMMVTLQRKGLGMGMVESHDIPFFAIRTDRAKYRENIVPDLARNAVAIKNDMEKEILTHLYREEAEQLAAVMKEQISSGQTSPWDLHQMVIDHCRLLKKCRLGYIYDTIFLSDVMREAMEVFGPREIADRFAKNWCCGLRDQEYKKTELADMIVYGNIMALGEHYLMTHIANATGPHSGFRVEAIKIIFDKMGITDISFEGDVWGEINKRREELKERLKCENGILWFDECCRKLVEPQESFPWLVLRKGYIGPVDTGFLEALKPILRKEPALEQYISFIGE